MSIISIPNGTRWKKDPVPPPSKYPYKITINCPNGQVDIEFEFGADPKEMTADQLAHAINMANRGIRAEVVSGCLSISIDKPLSGGEISRYARGYSIESKARRISKPDPFDELGIDFSFKEAPPSKAESDQADALAYAIQHLMQTKKAKPDPPYWQRLGRSPRRQIDHMIHQRARRR